MLKLICPKSDKTGDYFLPDFPIHVSIIAKRKKKRKTVSMKRRNKNAKTIEVGSIRMWCDCK